MSIKSSKLQTVAAIMAMAAMMEPGTGQMFTGRSQKTDEEKEIEQDNIRLKQGQKKFWYGSNYVWSLSQKRADKKAKKLGYL